jgi:hypothetical protein
LFFGRQKMKSIQEGKLKPGGKEGSRQSMLNGFGHYRKLPSVEEFRQCFERRGDVTVLREFLNSTASWVLQNFPSIELEVHQAATLGCAAREKNQTLDCETIRAQYPRLAILATDVDLQEIVEGNPSPKKVTAGMLSRVLRREESSIMRWAQTKRQ